MVVTDLYLLEDSTFLWTTAGGDVTDTEHGARLVFRHNTIDGEETVSRHRDNSSIERAAISRSGTTILLHVLSLLVDVKVFHL